MAILTNIVAADEDEYEAIGDSVHPVDEWSGIEKRDIDIPRLAMLHCLLLGDDYELAAGYYEPIFIGGEGALVLRIPDEIMVKLAGMEEEGLQEVAQELLVTEVFEQVEADPDEVEDLLYELGQLSQLAESQDQVLFVWMHPLLT